MNSSGHMRSVWYSCECDDSLIPVGSRLAAFWTSWNAEKLPNTTVMDKAAIRLRAQLLIESMYMYACLNQSSCFIAELFLLCIHLYILMTWT